MLDDHDLLAIHFDGGGNKEERARDKMVDSIYALSFSLDPFLHRAWDKTLLIAFGDLRAHSDGSARAKLEIEEELSTYGPSWKAWLFYSAGRFREALDLYARASRRAPKNDAYLARRAELHMRLLEPDSAFKYFAEAIKVASATEKNGDRLVRFYRPKAVHVSRAAPHRRRLIWYQFATKWASAAPLRARSCCCPCQTRSCPSSRRIPCAGPCRRHSRSASAS